MLGEQTPLSRHAPRVAEMFRGTIPSGNYLQAIKMLTAVAWILGSSCPPGQDVFLLSILQLGHAVSESGHRKPTKGRLVLRARRWSGWEGMPCFLSSPVHLTSCQQLLVMSLPGPAWTIVTWVNATRAGGRFGRSDAK